jgi:hypothetical protein
VSEHASSSAQYNQHSEEAAPELTSYIITPAKYEIFPLYTSQNVNFSNAERLSAATHELLTC